MSIKVKRGLAINLPTLEEGELGFTTDSYEMYVGSDNGNILLNNGEILIRRNNGMLQYAQSSRKNQWFDICSLEEIRGDQGIQGIQGIQGVKGDKGDKGERGIQGEKGNPFTYADFTPDQLRALKGEKGDTGAKGERGLTGDKGDRGVGLNYAWSGTRLGVKRDTDAQYTYVDLRGADGKDGKQGERGERGIQGEKGETPSIAHLEQQVSDKSKELDTKFNALTAKQQQDAEVVTARDGEVSLHARLERDLAKGKIHFVGVEGSSISTESEEGYLENVEILGNTWQDANNLSDIRSVGTKVEGQELYEIPVLSVGGNLFNINSEYEDNLFYFFNTGNKVNDTLRRSYIVPVKEGMSVKYINSKDIHVTYYTKDGIYISGEVAGDSRIRVVPKGTYFAKFGVRKDVGYEYDKLCVCESSFANDYYEPYIEDKLTILSPTQLEKVGDVADRIVCKDGVWGVEKNVVDFKIDNVNDWGVNYNADDYISFITKEPKFSSKSVCYSNKFAYSIDGDSSVEFVTVVSSGKIAISILKNKLDVATLQGFINWGVKENAFIKVSTENPEFIPLPHSQQVKLRTFADRTNISFLTEIEGTIKAQVPKSLGATVNTHTTQIDNLNKELDRVKKLEESTVTTVTSDKAFTTVSETTQGYFEDVKIEGKTLVNQLEKHTKHICDGTDANRIFKCKMIKPPQLNKKYTIVFKLENTTNATISFGFYDSNFIIHNYVGGVETYSGIICEAFTFKDVACDTLWVWGYKGAGAKFTVEDAILLEGDYTDKDITFFEGLKSVGQDSDEISVSSVNENLFDKNFLSKSSSELLKVSMDINTIGKDRLFVSVGENRTNANARVYLYDENGTMIKNITNNSSEAPLINNAKYEFNVEGINCATILFNNHSSFNSSEIYVTDVMVSYYNSNFIPHQSDKKQILYYNSTTQTWEKPILREWDSIEKHSDGKYYYHKRSGEVVLDASSKIYNTSISEDGTYCRGYVLLKGKKIGKAKLICNKLTSNNDSYSDGVNIIRNSSSNENVWLCPNIINVEQFPTFLEGLTIVYELAQEEVYECTNLDLITYNGETNLIVNSGAIQPKLELKVLSNVSNVIKLLQEKVSILENKFIKGLQQVLAGDMMSLAHLLYPEDFTLENDTPQVIPYIEEGDINE